MVELIRQKSIDDKNPDLYNKGITSLTIDLLDAYADYATKILLDKIYFYEHFHPEKLIKKGLFEENLETNDENINEFFISININISINERNYTDNINWDILNKEITPEQFAELTVEDEKLPKIFVIPIAYQIRKAIHNYVYDLFKNVAKNYEKYEQENYFIKEHIGKITRHSEDTTKNIITFLFDQKLGKLIGKKRKIPNESKILPEFLKKVKIDKENKNRNTKISDNNPNSYILETKGTKIIVKSNKKGKNLNNIEHDKQSTTMEEND